MSLLSPASETRTGLAGERQFLTFLLGNEEYGVDILKVQEIKGYSTVTAIPGTPAHVKGVMNLRGVVVPVVDLRETFALESAAITRSTVVIVVNVASRVLALVVDSVSDVLEVEPKQIGAAPDLGTRIDTSFITGVATRAGRLVILLDLEKLLRSDELGVLTSTT